MMIFYIYIFFLDFFNSSSSEDDDNVSTRVIEDNKPGSAIREEESIIEDDPIEKLRDIMPNGDIRYPYFTHFILDEDRGDNVHQCPFCVKGFPANSEKSLNLEAKELFVKCGKCLNRITIRSKAQRKECLRILETW